MSTITGTGRPSDRTEGNIGDIYIDSNSGNKYECCGIHKITTDKTTCYYIWVRINTAGSGGSDSGGTISGNFVSYSEPQDLTDEQKAQARANIAKYEEHLVELQFSGANKFIVLDATTGQNAINWEIADTVASTSEYGEGCTAFQYIADLISIGLSNDEFLLPMLTEIKADFTALRNAGALTTKKITAYYDSDTSWHKMFTINGEGNSAFIVTRYYDDGSYVTITTDASVETLKTYAKRRDGIDITLSMPAYCADAKAVGDALATKISAPVTTDDNGKILKVVDGKWAAVSPSEDGDNPDSGGNVDGLTTTEKNLILTLFRNTAYTSGNMGAVLTQLETLWSGSGDDTGGGDTHSHSYTSSVTTAATCTTAGVRTYTCSCGHSYTQSIPATGHKYANGVCTVCGAADPNYEPDTPDVPEVILTSISATYSGGDVVVGMAVTALTGIVVTAHYSDGTSKAVTGYTLSGTIAEGSNTITVTYQGNTTTFTVTGVAAAEAELLSDGLLGYWDLRNPAEVVAKDWHWAYPSNEGNGGLYASIIGGSKGTQAEPTFNEYGTNATCQVMDDVESYPGTDISTYAHFGTEFTAVILTKDYVPASTEQKYPWGVGYSVYAPQFTFRATYNTATGMANTPQVSASSTENAWQNYNFVSKRVNGSNLKVTRNDDSHEWNGEDFSGFVSWDDTTPLRCYASEGTVIGAAIYNRVLTDSELETVRRFFETLEVTS